MVYRGLNIGSKYVLVDYRTWPALLPPLLVNCQYGFMINALFGTYCARAQICALLDKMSTFHNLAQESTERIE